jgi:hypothetical protein
MTFVLKGALMENVALLNGFSTTSETRTVDDSKTSTLNLWTSDYISKSFQSKKPIAIAGNLAWTICAANSGWGAYNSVYAVFKPFKLEHEKLFTSDKVKFICPRAGVYEITINLVDKSETLSFWTYVQSAGVNEQFFTNFSDNKSLPKKVKTSSIFLPLTVGLNVSFALVSTTCTGLLSATFLIRELL